MDPNQEDLHLLYTDPGALMKKYLSLVDTIVQIHVTAGYIDQEEKQEYVHQILDEFIQRLPSIREQYNEKSMLRTYCAAIFRNLCRDSIRRGQRDVPVRIFNEPPERRITYITPLTELVIKQEVEFFGRAITLFGRKTIKVRLFLKAFYRLPLENKEVSDYLPDADLPELQAWINEIGRVEPEDDHGLYDVLIRLSLRAEGKRRTRDAVRKWIRARIVELVGLMNAARGTQHTEETISLLAERYFLPDRSQRDELPMQERRIGL
jgi:hypothetical protein